LIGGKGAVGQFIQLPPSILDHSNSVTTNKEKIMAVATIGELDLKEAAKEAVGNWLQFDCFSWDKANELEDADQFAIVYTRHRDSELLELSNAEVIAAKMEPFLDQDVFEEHHVHFAVAWIDGYAIRVYRDGQVTDAFKTYHDIQNRLADYPLLDEEDYSAREYEATIENIGEAAWRVKRQYDLPDDWETAVYRWLWDHEPEGIENVDGRGGWPSEDSLKRAFDGLGYERTDDE
jgi:hypothetical protein